MSPDLRQLRYFVAVAEESSYTRAAQVLTISQQSLSQQITLLERMLGVKLFDRDTRGTRLTAIGELFLPEARAVLTRADEAFDVVARAARGEAGSLRLAFLATTTNYLLPLVVRAVRQRLPELALSTEETTIASLVEGLRKGRYDVAFTRPPLVAGLATRTLVSEPVCAVLPEGHPLAGRAELTLAELAGERWVLTPRSSWEPWHQAFDESFRAAGFTPEVVHRDASVQALLGLVAAGVGITRLARSAGSLRRTGVVFVPISGEFVSTEMVWLAGNDSAALHGLLNVVTEAAASTDFTRAG
ncbi:LysR substrate-binding domain-containing protein [Amycolatopsis rhabdoformis]|uniref:LysR substrate-binding domain-containing protein n=1 Tax=Amycolatopsis rhabdoformis TaxID=1448059 RepID=A0ABZ1IMJ6_9PSEU|nr:LysR substrate-binding domain-containing protein [Amycolatopsis rhabdoformis]WSE34922.1 LysR substrate-binding domain-containing protein [Amycolatopsis rhabdoformis]